MYQELIKQYNNLSDEEKNALLVYKTRLGLLINDLDNEPDWNYYYDRYKHISESPQNILLQSLIFKSIDFTSIDTFKKSIYRIKDILDEATTKIVVPQDITVYRIVASDGEIQGIAKSDFVSTSLSFAETVKYATSGKNLNIYEIRIPAGSHVAISPYAIYDDVRNDRLIFSQSGDQEEVVLNTKNMEFNIDDVKDNDCVMYYTMTANDIVKKQARS